MSKLLVTRVSKEDQDFLVSVELPPPPCKENLSTFHRERAILTMFSRGGGGGGGGG